MLKEEYTNNEIFKKDIDIYFSRINDDKNIGIGLKSNCNTLYQYILNNNEINGFEILGLVYVERNMYYHNGETAKFGMSYTNRKKLLGIISKCIEDYLFQLSIYIIEQEISKNQ